MARVATAAPSLTAVSCTLTLLLHGSPLVATSPRRRQMQRSQVVVYGTEYKMHHRLVFLVVKRTAGLFVQVRRFICDRLASLLLFRTTTQTAKDDRKSGKSDLESNCHRLNDQYQTDRPESGDKVSNSQTLTSILGLLETRISIDDEKQEKSDKDAKMRRDWMLTAAVIDRLCFIVLTVIFVAGTLLFIALLLQS